MGYLVAASLKERLDALRASRQALSEHVAALSRREAELQRAHVAEKAAAEELAAAHRALRLQVSLHELTERVAGVGHWVMSRTEGRTVWSKSLFGIVGLAPRESMTLDEARELNPILEAAQFHAAIRRSDGAPEIYRVRRPGGEVRWIRASLIRAPEEAASAGEILGVVQDITAEHAATLALEGLVDDLEQRVANRTRDLESALAELDSFAHSVAHDLSAPLRVISGFAEMLGEDAAGRLTAEDLAKLARIRRSAVHMADLIADLLRLSRVNRTQLMRIDVDLSALAREIAGELSGSDPDRSVQWRIAEGLRADADPGLVRVLLQNLFGNAWKYSRGNPAAEIEFARCEGGRADEFHVRDNGVGFDMKFVDRLFAPFQRLHRADEFEGTGIGLATVQRIVRRHGGTVSAYGEEGKGASFRFSLSAPKAGSTRSGVSRVGGTAVPSELA